jgi:hypothetical protein
VSGVRSLALALHCQWPAPRARARAGQPEPLCSPVGKTARACQFASESMPLRPWRRILPLRVSMRVRGPTEPESESPSLQEQYLRLPGGLRVLFSQLLFSLVHVTQPSRPLKDAQAFRLVRVLRSSMLRQLAPWSLRSRAVGQRESHRVWPMSRSSCSTTVTRTITSESD